MMNISIAVRYLALIGSAMVLGGLTSPTLLEGQQTPGQRIPSRDRVHAEYINNIMDGINEARDGWTTAIAADRLDPLMANYAPDAMVIPPSGQPLYGYEAVREYWEETLPLVGAVQTGLGDLDASGQMAMIGGTYSIQWRQENGAVTQETGGLLTVFVQIGRQWLIRAQVFGTADQEKALPQGASK